MSVYCVVIPIYNDWEKLLVNIEIYQSLIEKHRGEIEFVLVDNGSRYIPSDSRLSDFVLLKCEKPGSYSARNFALTKLLQDYKYFIFTDADCKPDICWLTNIFRRCSDDNVQLLAGGVAMYSMSTRPNFVESYDLILGLPQKKYVSRGYAVTANLTISRDVFLSIGFFDDSRFSGGDAEFCQRAGSAGFKLEYEESALIYHPARIEFREIIRKVRRVAGGQTGSGSLKRRLNFFMKIVFSPVREFYFIFKSGGYYGWKVKLKATAVVFVLWPFRTFESIKAFVSSARVR
ncbi:glycosyltransferase family 2 protein [Salinispirillum sp. LH 10-3-1]|uniref:Glycosyltransferase family 2 protein n=1 Tax=Salinispirillum sp. LH 10-3-1 TaxID=2952525 RepID=A0AB38YJ26_9GAMM